MDKAKDLGAPAARTPADVLRAARARIARGWCRGQQARRADGSYALPTEPDAAAWCMYGALRAEGCSYGDRPVALIVQAVGVENFGDWQDGQATVTPVLAKFDEAIALAEAAQ